MKTFKFIVREYSGYNEMVVVGDRDITEDFMNLIKECQKIDKDPISDIWSDHSTSYFVQEQNAHFYTFTDNDFALTLEEVKAEAIYKDSSVITGLVNKLSDTNNYEKVLVDNVDTSITDNTIVKKDNDYYMVVQ